MIYKNFFKRFFDIVFSFLLLCITMPICIVTILVLLITKQKPILFSQLRPGYKEKIFRLYKFATMKNLSDNSGQLLSDEKRITNLGIWMRKYSIDELPQLFNVLKGNMSFIGPRPLLIEYLPRYSNTQKIRHTVKPGITGYAQVNGRNNIS